MITYDADVIRRHATGLYARAVQVIIATVIAWTAGGAAAMWFGLSYSPYILVTPQHRLWATIAAGVGGLIIGYGRGAAIAARLRLDAQIALCQVAIEANTRRHNNE